MQFNRILGLRNIFYTSKINTFIVKILPIYKNTAQKKYKIIIIVSTMVECYLLTLIFF